MKKLIQVENVGNVEVTQSNLTGAFSISIDGKAMTKVNKKQFILKGEGEEKTITAIVSGNSFQGFKLDIGGGIYAITESVPLYVYVLALIPFVVTIVLGNMTVLAQKGFYYVGGAIGGAISGMISILTIYVSTVSPKWWVKVLICLAGFAICFLTCYGVGNLIVAGLTK